MLIHFQHKLLMTLILRGANGITGWRFQAKDQNHVDYVCITDGFAVTLALDSSDSALVQFWQTVFQHTVSLVGSPTQFLDVQTPAG